MKSRLLAIVAIGSILSVNAYSTSSVDGTANATASVITDISVTTAQDLAFGNATVSDIAKTINPATDTTNSARFDVAGGASAAFSITLPASVNMTTGGGGDADHIIVVNSFTSSPATSSTLSGGGTRSVHVGATRAAIRATQAAGSYTGSFTVTFAYQ